MAEAEHHFDDADFRRGCITILEDVFKRIQELQEQERSILKDQFLGIIEGARVRALAEDDDEMFLEGVLYFYREILLSCRLYPNEMDEKEFEEFLKWLDGEHSDLVVADL